MVTDFAKLRARRQQVEAVLQGHAGQIPRAKWPTIVDAFMHEKSRRSGDGTPPRMKLCLTGSIPRHAGQRKRSDFISEWPGCRIGMWGRLPWGAPAPDNMPRTPSEKSLKLKVAFKELLQLEISAPTSAAAR